jgi:anti-sigma factor RsiW
MTTPFFHDVELLSASLDGQLSKVEETRLETRIRLDPGLATALVALRQTRAILRLTPKHRLPHNFTLTRAMAGIKPPLPRLVPAFSWASAVAMLLFFITLGANQLGRMSFGASAPMMAAAPMTSENLNSGGNPVATQPGVTDNTRVIPSPEPFSLTAPQTTPSGEPQLVAPDKTPSSKTSYELVEFLIYVWLGLAGVFIAISLLIRRASLRAFHRDGGQKSE